MKKKYDIDESRVLESLSQKIKIPTISYPDSKRINKKAFSDFKTHLKDRYPLIYENAIYKEIGTGVLYHIKGEKSEDPTVLMAHFDVVPAEGNWTFEPFSGDIDDSYIHGRGTLDTNCSGIAVMES